MKMNLEALEYIVNNRADLIEDNVIGTRYDPLAVASRVIISQFVAGHSSWQES